MLLLKKKNFGFFQLDYFVDQVSLNFNFYLKLKMIIMNVTIYDLKYFLNYEIL
jgi:hypothetical protein